MRPFVVKYCVLCHAGAEPAGQLDMSVYETVELVMKDHERWGQILGKLKDREMPPEDAAAHPTAEARRQVIDWIEAMRNEESRRLSNAEYNPRSLRGRRQAPGRSVTIEPWPKRSKSRRPVARVAGRAGSPSRRVP